MRILVVDDSATIRALVKMSLRQAKLAKETHFASNGMEAVEWIRANGRPDLILLDVNMPVMNGLEFLQNRARLAVPVDIPVIIVSTEGHDDDVQRGLAAGAQGYLRKPFNGPQLDDVIRRTLPQAATPI
jgi:two-component system chemotaxis response regulator CheY